MPQFKHPLRKVLKQDVIDEIEKKYEEEQKQKRESNFKAKIEKIEQDKKMEEKGFKRIIITKNPREPETVIEGVVEEEKPIEIPEEIELKEEEPQEISKEEKIQTLKDQLAELQALAELAKEEEAEIVEEVIEEELEEEGE